MATIKLDDQVFISEAAVNSVGDILDQIRELAVEGQIISSVIVDGKDVFELPESQLRAIEVSEDSDVQIQRTSVANQVMNSIQGLMVFIKELRPILRQSGRELRYGAVGDASSRLAQCFEGMEMAVKSIEQVVGILPNLGVDLALDDLKHFSHREGEMMGELVVDFNRQDWLSLADRLEFQLDPLMGRWQAFLNRVVTSIQDTKAAN